MTLCSNTVRQFIASQTNNYYYNFALSARAIQLKALPARINLKKGRADSIKEQKNLDKWLAFM